MKLHNLFLTFSIGIFLCGCMPKLTDIPEDSKVEIDLKQDMITSVNKDWWEQFGDKNLIFLLQKARDYNTDIKIARTHIQAAKGAMQVARSTLFPSADFNGDLEYSKNFLHALFAIAEPSLEINYSLDIFGKNKKERENKLFQAQASIAQSYATKLSVDVAVAKTYVNLVALNDHLKLLKDTLKTRKIDLEIAQDKQKEGYISEYDVQQAKIQYESTKEQIPSTELSIEKQKNALEVLTGIKADELIVASSLKDLQEPHFPSNIPSSELRNRPDVAYAEFELAASSAALAKARLNFLPDFNLSANIGAMFFDKFDSFLGLGGITGGILAPLFKGGELKGEFTQANAQRDEAAYNYQKTVINAFKDFKNAKSSILWIKKQQIPLINEINAASKTLKYAKDRYENGYSAYLEVTSAEQSLLQLQGNFINLKTTYIESMVDLYQALGGGFSPKDVTKDSKELEKQIASPFKNPK